ncbi:MAG: protein-disulfide reductase DsbD family protein [Alphaproteobacteria bacterium]|jgi:suppressor for copper-sensitivity B
MRRAFRLCLMLIFFAMAVAPRHALALAGAWDVNDHVSTRLVAAPNGVGDQTSVQLGLQFRLKPGWKIYWRNPGESGLPPSADWTGTENVRDPKIFWPAPTRFDVFGLETLGYKDEVVLPVSGAIVEPGKHVRVRAKLRYLTCNEICVPYDVSLFLNLPQGLAEESLEAALIDKYVKLTPGAVKGLTIEQAVLAVREKSVVLSVDAKSDIAFAMPDLFVEGPDGAFFGRPKITYADQGRRAYIEVVALGVTQADIKPGDLTLTLVDGARALETVTPVRFDTFHTPVVPDSASTGETRSVSVWQVIAFAILGGLILNLMPCVLPVLSIKLLSVADHGGGDRFRIRVGFFASAAGVITSLLAIAGALVALKAAGMSVGWGIQFQQPVFLTIMAILVTLFAYNLWGLFEIRLPQILNDFAAIRGHGDSIGAHFMTGAFATVLATPCSAPFVGTAVGYALSRGAGETFLVFSALGVGLAIPYIIIGLFPGAVARLPRPGAWMNGLRKVLALALGATTLWLLSILATQIGYDDMMSVGALLALMGAAFVAKRFSSGMEMTFQLGRHAGIACVVMAAACIAIPVLHDSTLHSAPAQATLKDDRWTPFDLAEIDRHVRAGNVVFVDVTADWCITCKVNKKIVLDRDPVAAFLKRDDVVAMRGDWTLPNPKIAAYLASFERYGIPFNAMYGPGAPGGRALPELLSSNIVMGAATAVKQSGFAGAPR